MTIIGFLAPFFFFFFSISVGRYVPLTLGFDALSLSLHHHFPFFDRICLLPSLMQLHTHVGLLVLPSRLDVSSILYLINPHTLFRLPFSLAHVCRSFTPIIFATSCILLYFVYSQCTIYMLSFCDLFRVGQVLILMKSIIN